MKRLLPVCLLACALSGAVEAATLLNEGFEGTFPPDGWAQNSVDQSTTYKHTGTYSAKFTALGDYLITSPLTNAQTLIFWIYPTAANPGVIVETSASASGPWSAVSGSPFSDTAEQWTEQTVSLTSSNTLYVQFRKSGSGYLYIDDVSAADSGVTPSNNPPVLSPIGNQSLTVSNALNFTVTASDADNDSIILSASNLPPGAVFNTVTNIGGVTNSFNWASAAPVGVYTSTFYAADGSTNDFETISITVTNTPAPDVLTGAVWNVYYNLPQQSGTSYPDQFRIRDALLARINALQSGNSAILSTFTFSAEEGAGTIMNAMDAALDRGALISFVADGRIQVGTIYGGTNSLLSLSTRSSNPLTLAVDGSTSGIMHDKLGLFDYGGTNQWVFTASWNFTLAASADQWNIALEARSPSLYAIYTNETAEFLAGRFHDNPAKSHAHDGATFTLDGSWGTNFVRFAPYPDSTQGGNNAERDITNLIAQAQSGIVFALNKLNRTPIRDALVAAADRGVLIKGVMPRSDTDPGGVSANIYSYLTNSANYTTTNIVQMLPAYSKADYSALDAGESDLIHAKYMVIDPESTNAIVIHGSANWTYSALVSDHDNDENVVFLRHNEIAARFYEDFQRITGTGLFDEGNSTIVEWNFNDSNPIADGGISANATQTVVRVPAPASYTYTGNALSANGWNGGAGTKYWETSFSTEQHSDIKISSVQTASSTGPAYFKLQYKVGALGTYADVTNATVRVPNGGYGTLTRVSLPGICDNQSSIFIRWIMTSNTAARVYDDVQSGGRGSIDDIIVTGTAHNQPPVLDPIGNQTVFENQSLTFPITASDPVDGDPITLTATRLPTGAVFTNGVFTWSNAVPVGTYAVTFYATDKDGSDTETVNVTVLQRPDLLISEIADPAGTGGGDYRFVELYNAGTNAIDLAADNWTLSKQVNGGTSWSDTSLTGTIAGASAWVIAYSAPDFENAYGISPNQENSSINGTGDDAYFLYRDGDHTTGLLIDAYGEPDTDGTDTAWDYTDSRAERNKTVLQPNPVWTASEWTITPNASTNDMTPGEHGPVPEFQGLENQFVFTGDNLSLTITATNSVLTNDVITLSSNALPAGATFGTAVGTHSVSSTLNWNSPTAGVYTATFDAAGAAGTHTASITITVSSTSRIDGYFYGWKNDTLVKLRNGQFWKNLGGVGTSFDPALPGPTVTVVRQSNTRQMYVTGVPDSQHKSVVQMDILESTVTSTFSGLHDQNIYQLADGTIWKQVSFENISSNVSPVTAWRWIENGQQKMRFLGRNQVVIGTCMVEAATPPADSTIHSQIDGWFRGRQSKRVFVLKNGQFWQQISLESSIQSLSNPGVTITNWFQSEWRMSIDGQSGYVSVQQLTNVTRTAVDRWFYGFGRDHIFSLADGSWWKQTSSEISTSTRFTPEVLIWNESGTDYLEMPDEGRTVSAEQLAVDFESTVTNTFTGLHYGNLYRLDGAGDWLQFSFENVSTNVSNPSVMLWTEGTLTNMIVRDSRNVTIGTCIVVDPILDADNDGFSNAAEVLAGSNPQDSQSRFELRQTDHSILSWDAVKGRIYTIEWTPSLTERFQPLENSIVWPQNSWTDTVHAVSPEGFYRISVRLAQ